MSKKLLYAALLVLPGLLLASGAELGTSHYFSVTGRETDFVPRLFNFLVFAGLLYYLLATPIKEFFVGRREGIAKQLNEIESKLQEAKEAEKSARQAVVDSEKKAKEIVADSIKEIELLQSKIEEASAQELKMLDGQYDEKIALEERKMVRETIGRVLNENITSDDIPLSEKKVIDIVAKKVA